MSRFDLKFSIIPYNDVTTAMVNASIFSSKDDMTRSVFGDEDNVIVIYNASNSSTFNSFEIKDYATEYGKTINFLEFNIFSEQKSEAIEILGDVSDTTSMEIYDLNVTNVGTGYSAGTLTASGGGGIGFKGNYTVSGSGAIKSVTILNRGEGFTSIPTINISDSGDGNAVIAAKLRKSLLKEENQGTKTLNLVLNSGIDAAKIHDGSVSNTEFGYLNTVSSNIQTQLNTKQSTLIFGKSSGNTLRSEEDLITNDVLLMGSSHVKGRTFAEFKSDLSLNNVTNDAQLPLSGGTVTGDINLNNDVKIIYGDAGEHILGDGTDLQLTSSGSVTVTSGIFEVVSTGTGTPTLKIKNTSNQFGSGAQLHFDINPDDNVGADGDDIGLILFKTDDDGGNVTSYASIKGEISDASNGTEDGKLSLNIAVAGTLTTAIEMKESSSSPIPDITINGSSVFNSTLDLNNQRIVDAQRIGFNGGGFITSLIDNDDMSSASSTSVSSSESIKAYIDTTITQIIPCGFNYSSTAGTKVFLPLNGYIIEMSTTSNLNEYVSFVAPFDGYLDQVVVRSEEACGSTIVGLHKSSTGTEVPNSTASASVTVNMTTDDTPFKFNFTSSNTFSAGQILAVSFQPSNDANDTNASVVFVFDRTSGL